MRFRITLVRFLMWRLALVLGLSYTGLIRYQPGPPPPVIVVMSTGTRPLGPVKISSKYLALQSAAISNFTGKKYKNKVNYT
jgi:hypothetical protein